MRPLSFKVDGGKTFAYELQNCKSNMDSNTNLIETIPEEPDEVSDPAPYYDMDQSYENNTETEEPPLTLHSDDEDKTEDVSDLPREVPSSLKLEMSTDSLTAVFYEDRSDASNLSRLSGEENPELQSSGDAVETEAPCDTCKFCRSIGDELLHNHAQEPWPKDVRLFQPYEVEQILLPDNANCLAVQTFLKMCNLEYTVDPRKNAEAMSPTGKVPFIKCGAFIVAELEGIVQFVGSKGISLTQDMSAENRADMRAYMTLVNNVLGNAELYICWCDPETYSEVTKPRYGSVYPWPLNHIQTWTKRSEETKRLKVLGWQQKTLEEVYNDVETCCQALTDRLDGNEYFYGSNYTELDALLYSHLYLLLTVPLPSHLGMVVRKYAKLVDYCRKIDRNVMQRETDLTPRAYKKARWEKPSARVQSRAQVKEGHVNVSGVVI